MKKVAIFWGGKHTLPGQCDENTWLSFYNSGWKFGFESLGYKVDFFAWEDNEEHPGYDLYVYAPGYLSNKTFRTRLHKPNVFFTEEASIAPIWAINHCYYYDHVFLLDYINWIALRKAGLKNAWWLPGAVDPTVFYPLKKEKRFYNSCFLGNYDCTVVIDGVNTRWDYIYGLNTKTEKSLVGKNCYAREANKAWNNAIIGVDIPIVDFCSFRLMQIAATETFILTRKSRVNSGIQYLLEDTSGMPLFGSYTGLEDLVGNAVKV